MCIFDNTEIPRQNLPDANAVGALRNYNRVYNYDANGNIERIRHQAGANSWTNAYSYDQSSNKLSNTISGSSSLTYLHDVSQIDAFSICRNL